MASIRSLKRAKSEETEPGSTGRADGVEGGVVRDLAKVEVMLEAIALGIWPIEAIEEIILEK